MSIDISRITKYLRDIKEDTLKIEIILDKTSETELLGNEIIRFALKYLVIEIVEAMANVLQHILAKHFGLAVKGYIDTINKGFENGIVTRKTFQKIKPFFDFRNSLIHRYWLIDEGIFVKNLKDGYRDFLSPNLSDS